MCRSLRCPRFLLAGVIAILAFAGCDSPTNLAGGGDSAAGSGGSAGSSGSGGNAGGGGSSGSGGTGGSGGSAGSGGTAGIGGGGGDTIGGDTMTNPGDAYSGDTNNGDTAGGDPLVGDTRTGDLDPGGDTDVNLCPRLPPPADYIRAVVISHPYAADFSQANIWEVWELAVDGTLSNTSVTFSMGRSTGGVIAFTPDGEIGLIAQESGGIGVFRLSASGPPEVIYADYSGTLYPFYASDVIVDAAGRTAYVVDSDTRGANGGGIYVLRIECDGTLTELGFLAPANTPSAMRFIPGQTDRVVVATDDILASTGVSDLHLLDWGSPPSVLSSVAGMGITDPTIAGFAVTPDGRYVLMGDNNTWNSGPNGVGIVEIASDALFPVTVIEYVEPPPNDEDPVAIVVSPYNNAALVIDGYSNGVWVLAYDSTNTITPFVDLGELTYATVPAPPQAPPQLPCCAVVIERGSLTGHILLSENVGIRQLQFEPGGGVTDIGLIAGTVPIVRIVGAIGVQP